jgi:hypothetical protein
MYTNIEYGGRVSVNNKKESCVERSRGLLKSGILSSRDGGYAFFPLGYDTV